MKEQQRFSHTATLELWENAWLQWLALSQVCVWEPWNVSLAISLRRQLEGAADSWHGAAEAGLGGTLVWVGVWRVGGTFITLVSIVLDCTTQPSFYSTAVQPSGFTTYDWLASSMSNSFTQIQNVLGVLTLRSVCKSSSGVQKLKSDSWHHRSLSGPGSSLSDRPGSVRWKRNSSLNK